jgi:hypothetical protein
MVTVWMRRQESLGIALVLAAAVAGGCKSGSSWTAKPSWWTFGDASKDPAALASAPPAPTDVTKPSATAKPYPTTTTPEGYVLENAKRAGESQVAAATASPTEPAAVTYGSTPVAPPAAAPVAAQAAVAPATSPAGAGSLSSITPQVGPYGSAPGSSPGDQSLPATSTAGYPAAFAAAPATAPAAPPTAATAFGAPAATSPGFDPAGTRVADARGSEAWTPPATLPAGGGDSRYGASNGSRFSGGMSAVPAAAPVAEALMPSAPPAELAPPAAVPPAVPVAAPSAGLPAAAPAAAPAALAPPTPTRRPEAGYRPAGTSSYRPSRTILAGDSGGTPSAVQPASYEAAIPAG